MSLSTPAIQRPIATILLTAAIAIAGIIAFTVLPVSSLPQIDSPTIMVTANLPGASPEVMAAAVATPLERQFGHIAGISEMTSQSSTGSSSVVLQFDMPQLLDSPRPSWLLVWLPLALALWLELRARADVAASPRLH